MIYLVISADDFGQSEEINESVRALARDGRITSTALLANGPAFEHAVSLVRSLPHTFSVGVHLNAREFTPLTFHQGLCPLLSSSGEFAPASELTYSASLLKAVYAEWGEQIRKCLAAGITPTHIDSHGHMHTRPPLAPVAVALAHRFGIRRVRISKNIYLPEKAVSQALRMKKWLYNNFLRLNGLRRTTYFTDLADFLSLWRRCPAAIGEESVVECMVHPGNPHQRYQDEIRELQGKWLADGFRLISYKRL